LSPILLTTKVIFLHQGELEQLTVVEETSGGVSEQCSPNRVPFQKDVEKTSDFHIIEDEESLVVEQKHSKGKKGGLGGQRLI
jgi:hypothetical protein